MSYERHSIEVLEKKAAEIDFAIRRKKAKAKMVTRWTVSYNLGCVVKELGEITDRGLVNHTHGTITTQPHFETKEQAIEERRRLIDEKIAEHEAAIENLRAMRAEPRIVRR